MKKQCVIFLSLILMVNGGLTAAEQNDYPIMKIEKFGEKVLTISSFTDNSRILAISTQKGLVVVNTTWSPDSAEHMKSIIEKEFGRNDYAYVINTDEGDARVYGNAAFKGVPIIAHAQTLYRLVSAKDSLRDQQATRAIEFEQRVTRTENQLKQVEHDSAQAKFMRNWIDFCRVVARDMKKDFEFLFPNITFTDSLTLDMGDMTIHLSSFGLSEHSGHIAVVIPEEGVVYLGDLIHAIHKLPMRSDISGRVDVEAFLENLNKLLDKENNVKYVLRSNGLNWSKERLAQQIQFITGLINYVNACDSAGKSYSQTLENVDNINELKPKFPYISEWADLDENILLSDIRNFTQVLWTRNREMASIIILQAMREQGIDAAKAKFRAILNGEDKSFFLLDSDLNQAGYSLLRERKFPEAIAVFEMNVTAFPNSSNVYDSLGEALMDAGRIEDAIANYEKSLELDPGNDNAKAKIKLMREKRK